MAERNTKKPKKKVKKKDKSKLTDSQMRMLAVELDPCNAGITADKLAKLVGLSYGHVQVLRHLPEYKQALREHRQEAIDVLHDARVRAALKLVELVDSENSMVAIRACENILGSVLSEKTQPDRKVKISLEDLKSKTDDEIIAVINATIEAE